MDPVRWIEDKCGMKSMMMFLLGASLCFGESIFDGKSMKGWTVQKGEEGLWRVEGGAIIGGSLTKKETVGRPA